MNGSQKERKTMGEIWGWVVLGMLSLFALAGVFIIHKAKKGPEKVLVQAILLIGGLSGWLIAMYEIMQAVLHGKVR